MYHVHLYTEWAAMPSAVSERILRAFDENALVITDDQGVRVYGDHLEPEDVRFTRDLDWVLDELLNAYQQGVKDGRAERDADAHPGERP